MPRDRAADSATRLATSPSRKGTAACSALCLRPSTTTATTSESEVCTTLACRCLFRFPWMISEQQSISMSNFYNYQQHGFSGVPPPPPPSYHSTQHQQPPPAQPVVVPPQPAPLRVVMPSLVVPSLNVVRAHQPPPAPAPTHAPAPAMHYQQQLTNPVPATADSLVDDLVNQIRSMPSIVKPPQPHSVLQSAVGGLFGSGSYSF